MIVDCTCWNLFVDVDFARKLNVQIIEFFLKVVESTESQNPTVGVGCSEGPNNDQQGVQKFQ